MICRTIRLLRTIAPKNWEIIVTSHNESYEFEGCHRHEPLNNIIEVDRFTEELIEDDMCFFYGDTYYTENAIKTILNTPVAETTFFGNEKSIVAVRVVDGRQFRVHKQNVRKLFLDKKIDECKGWQVYRSFTGQMWTGELRLTKQFMVLGDETTDINTIEEYKKLLQIGVNR